MTIIKDRSLAFIGKGDGYIQVGGGYSILGTIIIASCKNSELAWKISMCSGVIQIDEGFERKHIPVTEEILLQHILAVYNKLV